MFSQFERINAKLDEVRDATVRTGEWRRGHDAEHRQIEERLTALNAKVNSLRDELIELRTAVRVDKAKITTIVGIVSALASTGVALAWDLFRAAG